MPPSTSTVARPATARAMSGSTSAVAGHPSSTRPPWLLTTMALAPASTAFSAARAVMTPLMMKGTSRLCAMARSCSADLGPAGGSRPFKNGSPAASTSMATANDPQARASSRRRSSASPLHGFTVGTPTPFVSLMAWQDPTNSSIATPSPVKAATPSAWAAARDMRL